MSDIVKIPAAPELNDIISLKDVKVEPPKAGQKYAYPTNTKQEEEELAVAYEQMRQELSVLCIESRKKLAHAVWDDDANAVRVLRKSGKFDNFGYSRGGQHYLEYFEALYLLEMNRLQLDYHAIPVSLEQAYVLLLGEEASIKFNEYLLYAEFTQAGYILVKHANIDYNKPKALPVATVENCIWAIMLNGLQSKPIEKHIKSFADFAKTKKSMDSIKAHIIEQKTIEATAETEEMRVEFIGKCQPSGKRKNDDLYESAAKRPCTGGDDDQLASTSTSTHSLLDTLKSEKEYKCLQKLFGQLDVIKLHRVPIDADDENVRALYISFDVHLPKTGFRKSSPNAPHFRLIVLAANESFPSYDEIALCHQRQLTRVPLIVASVSEAKQIHAFVYHFSS